MRIVVFGNQAFSMVNFRAPLLQAMVQRGHEVYALAPGLAAPFRDQLAAIGVEPIDAPLERTGLNPLRDLSDMVKIGRTIIRLKPDALLAFTIKPIVFGTIIAALAKVPKRFALITGLGYAFSTGVGTRGRAIQFVARILYRIALHQAQIVFVQNADDADELAQRRIVPESKISVVNGTGVDLAVWSRMPLPAGGVTFTMAARLIGEKGVREYVSAARRIKSSHPNTRFLLLGDLDSNPSAISIAEVSDWIREGIVEWPGHVHMRPWLAQTSVFVLPSYREGVPRSTQEAMASGRPIITTDVPGCRETVVDGENGYLVPPRDVEALADAMLRFIANPDRIAAMGQKSRKLAEERFDVRSVNQRMLSKMNI